MPLEQPLRIGQRPVGLRIGRGREDEDLGLDLGRRRCARVVLPEGDALRLEPVGHDEPFQVAQPGAVQPRVQAAAAGVLAEEEVARQLAPGHAVEGRQLRVIALDPRQPVVPEIVLRLGGVPVPRLEQADDVLAEVGPVAGGHAVVRDVGIQRIMGPVGRGLGQIAGQDVVQGPDVRRALDAGMASHGQDAATRTADVAEQELQDAPGSDHLAPVACWVQPRA